MAPGHNETHRRKGLAANDRELPRMKCPISSATETAEGTEKKPYLSQSTQRAPWIRRSLNYYLKWIVYADARLPGLLPGAGFANDLVHDGFYLGDYIDCMVSHTRTASLRIFSFNSSRIALSCTTSTG